MDKLFFCALYAAMNVSGAAIIKWKLKTYQLSDLNSWIGFLLDFRVIGAFGLIFLSAMVLFKALAGGNFSLIVPIATGINFAFTIILGLLLFKEQLNMTQYVGLFMIFAGITAITLAKQAQ